MGLYRDVVVPQDQSTVYAYSGKVAPSHRGGRVHPKDEAWERLGLLIQDKFGDTGATVSEIYSEIGAPIRLSYYEIAGLVRSAKEAGYLSSKRI